MSTSRSTLPAILFFGLSFLCIWNPEFLPARTWFNGILEVVFGWCR